MVFQPRRTILLVIVGLFSFGLVGCTEQRELRKLAEQAALEISQDELRSEALENFTDKPEMLQRYLTLVTGQSKFEAKEAKIDGDQASVEVVVGKVPKSVRTALMGVIRKHDAQKDHNLNIVDAMGLIQARLGIPPGALEMSTMSVGLRKNSGWQVVGH